MSSNCPICGADHGSDGALRDHAWDAHDACHYCGDRFDDESALHRHWLATHPDDLDRVERKRAESDVDELTFGDRLEHQGAVPALTRSRTGRRALLVGGAVAIAGGVGAWASGALGGDSSEGTGGDGTDGGDGEGTNPVAAAPIPSEPGEYRYAVAGSGDADLTVTYYGSWKCPYCAEFSNGFLGTLVEEYVEPGDVAIEYRNLSYIEGEPFLGPDAPDAERAALAVWNVDPGSYWPYHEHVMRNQPPESERWATADRLATFAEEAGVADPDAVRSAVEEGEYEDAVVSASEAAVDAGVEGTPYLVVDGTVVSPFEQDRTRQVIEDALPEG